MAIRRTLTLLSILGTAMPALASTADLPLRGEKGPRLRYESVSTAEAYADFIRRELPIDKVASEISKRYGLKFESLVGRIGNPSGTSLVGLKGAFIRIPVAYDLYMRAPTYKELPNQVFGSFVVLHDRGAGGLKLVIDIDREFVPDHCGRWATQTTERSLSLKIGNFALAEDKSGGKLLAVHISREHTCGPDEDEHETPSRQDWWFYYDPGAEFRFLGCTSGKKRPKAPSPALQGCGVYDRAAAAGQIAKEKSIAARNGYPEHLHGLKLKATASQELPPSKVSSYGAANAVDGDLETAWCFGSGGAAEKEWIQICNEGEKMGQDTRLIGIALIPGYAKSPQAWRANGRVTKVRLVDAHEPARTKEAVLKVPEELADVDGAVAVVGGFMTEDWHETKDFGDPLKPLGRLFHGLHQCVRFEILEFRPGKGSRDVCISEIAFEAQGH